MSFYEVAVHIQSEEKRFDFELFYFFDITEMSKFLMEIDKAPDLFLESIEEKHFRENCESAMQILSWKRMDKHKKPETTKAPRATTAKRRAA